MTSLTNPGQNPLGYLGVIATMPPNLYNFNRAPLATDIGYVLGSIAIYPTANMAWILTSVSAGVAVWSEMAAGAGGALFTINTNAPIAGNYTLAGTAAQITVTQSAGTSTLTIPAVFTAPGSIASTTTMTAGTSITSTLGNITATNGNVVMSTAGNKIIIATGANASVGTSGVMAGTPGAVTVATTASSATAKIFYSRNITGGTPGQVSITAQDGTGFTLTSTGNETSTFNWWIINA